jgi:CBS domain containing-hemolysin-like protein
MTDDTRSTSSDSGRGIAHWLGHFLENLGLRNGGSIRETIAEALSQDGSELADLSPQERAMLTNVLGLRERRIGEVMVPRTDIIAVPADITLGELLRSFRTAGHSRLPVYEESLDDPRGMIHIRDFVDFLADGALEAAGGAEADAPAKPDLGAIDLSVTLSAANILRPVLYAPPTMPALDLLVRMQATRTHIALVIDEYGGTDGLVSIEDLIEIVVGEIEDEHDLEEAPAIVAAEDGSFDADARASLSEIREATGIDLSDVEGADEVETLGGLIAMLAGRVPLRGETVSGPEGLAFEVIEADPRRVRQVRITRQGGPPGPDGLPAEPG